MIFYGINGEGLGHLSRSLTIIDKLDCPVHIFTYGTALSFLKQLQSKKIVVHAINGIRFSYNNGTINYVKLLQDSVKFFKNIQENYSVIESVYKQYHPKLFITDFEPSIPRFADKNNIPVISIDNQHRFSYIDLSKLPLGLRTYGALCGLVAKLIVPNPAKVIISTFHFDKILARNKDVIITNGLIRDELDKEKVKNDKFILSYLRPSIQKVEYLLSKINYPVKMYGLPKKHNHIEYKDLGNSFMDDLLNCSHVVCSAGNQLISECRYLNKPCLVIPEPTQYEQYINGYYVNQLNIGKSIFNQDITLNDIENFMENKIYMESVPNGLFSVLDTLQQFL